MRAPDRPTEHFRRYGEEAPERVRALYRENHRRQTLDFVLAKKAEYAPLRRRRMSVWEAFEALDELVDESDPDLELPQSQHALQTAEALRSSGAPPWLVLTGLVHDLGKVLCLYGEPQWAVVGDTFPVGCAFSDRVVFPEYFAENPDASDPTRSTRLGIYSRGCGLDALHLSWGHDEYLYQVVRRHLPPQALAIVRYHSFYAWHQDDAYGHLTAPGDEEALRWVREFSRFDLYSKSDEPIELERLRPVYEPLVRDFLPPILHW